MHREDAMKIVPSVRLDLNLDVMFCFIATQMNTSILLLSFFIAEIICRLNITRYRNVRL
jgi:hypothetical protein